MGYKVIRLGDVSPLDHPFGKIFELFTKNDHPGINIAIARIRDDKAHYHKKVTEFYYIISGTGKVYLNDDEVPLAPGTCVMIKPGTRHRAVSDSDSMDILVVSSPPYDSNDKFYD